MCSTPAVDGSGRRAAECAAAEGRAAPPGSRAPDAPARWRRKSRRFIERASGRAASAVDSLRTGGRLAWRRDLRRLHGTGADDLDDHFLVAGLIVVMAVRRL